MGHIYQGALFTISAVHAIHTGAGLFTARSFTVTSVARKGSDMHSNHKQLYIRERKDKPWVEDIHGPLDQRAWCLQERLMSRALLHFREDGMAWEGSTPTIFESSIFGKAAYPDLKTLFKQHSSQSLQPSLPVPQHTIYNMVRACTPIYK
jgi:hypothetical protein